MTKENKIKALEANIAKCEKYLTETKSKVAANAYLSQIVGMRLEISKLRRA